MIIEDELIDRLDSVATSHYPKEFGGFLMGRYSGDRKTLFVTDSILPKTYKNSPISFERSVDGVESSFLELFNERGIYYVGEWHSHPDGSTGNSGTDLNAMINTAACETVRICNPILLVLSVDKLKMTDHAFYFFEDNRLTAYEQS